MEYPISSLAAKVVLVRALELRLGGEMPLLEPHDGRTMLALESARPRPIRARTEPVFAGLAVLLASVGLSYGPCCSASSAISRCVVDDLGGRCVVIVG